MVDFKKIQRSLFAISIILIIISIIIVPIISIGFNIFKDFNTTNCFIKQSMGFIIQPRRNISLPVWEVNIPSKSLNGICSTIIMNGHTYFDYEKNIKKILDKFPNNSTTICGVAQSTNLKYPPDKDNQLYDSFYNYVMIGQESIDSITQMKTISKYLFIISFVSFLTSIITSIIGCIIIPIVNRLKGYQLIE
jgi:hypothetical protein